MEKKRKHPSPKPRKKHEKPVGEHMGGAFHPKEDGYDGYRALTQCVLTPAKPQGVRAILSARQKELLLWLTEAGLRLTTAELVFLTEHHVAPQINLLGDRNRQNLTETIYTQETIFDNILEAQMEHAAVRDEVVSALLRLSQFQFDELNIDLQGDYFQTEVAALFCAYGQKGSTTHDEEENAADHHILQNAAGRQAKRRRRTAYAARVEAFTKICYNFLKKF